MGEEWRSKLLHERLHALHTAAAKNYVNYVVILNRIRIEFTVSFIILVRLESVLPDENIKTSKIRKNALKFCKLIAQKFFTAFTIKISVK